MSGALAFICGLVALTIAIPAGYAQEPFFAGKRLTILVNFAPGGSTDTEARVFARHIGRLIDGQPNIVVQNMDGAGGLVGAKYVGEVGQRDGTLAGYFTATGFIYALDPERFKADFTTARNSSCRILPKRYPCRRFPNSIKRSKAARHPAGSGRPTRRYWALTEPCSA